MYVHVCLRAFLKGGGLVGFRNTETAITTLRITCFSHTRYYHERPKMHILVFIHKQMQ